MSSSPLVSRVHDKSLLLSGRETFSSSFSLISPASTMPNLKAITSAKLNAVFLHLLMKIDKDYFSNTYTERK